MRSLASTQLTLEKRGTMPAAGIHAGATADIPLLTMRNVEHWYAIYVLSNHEKRVEYQMKMRGIEVFLPLLTVSKRWKNRTNATLQIPLFPSYVFAKIALRDKVQVLEIPRVLSIVGTAGGPIPLPDEEFEILRQGLHQRQVDPYPYIKVGDRARICCGPLTGLEGIVVRKDRHLRIVLSVDLIMRSIAVHVTPDEIEALPRDVPAAG